MTTEIEKTFFDTFGIEPKERKACNSFPCGNPRKSCENCNDYTIYKIEYPQITDRILLELICILGNTSYFLITDDGLPIDVDGLKKSVLHSLTLQAKIDKNNVLKHQVRTLFGEG